MAQKIYRVEHKECGLGVFHAYRQIDPSYQELEAYQEFSRNHNIPIPQWDMGLGSIDSDEFCAFRYKTHLQRNINKSIVDGLYSVGFRVYEITVSKCRKGKHQVLYLKEDIIEQKDVTDKFR